MSCLNCGRSASDHERQIYTSERGWQQCSGLIDSGEVGLFIKIQGRSTYRKLYDDTKAFRDKAVRDAEAKKRKVNVGR